MPNLRARAYESEVDWILRNSFPTLRTGELSRRLRAAGCQLGSANIAEHEAIAATQAAIWHFTNGLELDDRPLNVPVAVQRTADAITFEFDGEPQLGGYSVDLASGTAASLTLQKSADGIVWRDVAASRLSVEAGAGRHRKTLGVGTTLSESRHGRPGKGYRYYRLNIVADRMARIDLRDVRFWLTGSGNYRNADRIVHLYNHLLAGARLARHQLVAPRLTSADATTEGGLVGPFRLHATPLRRTDRLAWRHRQRRRGRTGRPLRSRHRALPASASGIGRRYPHRLRACNGERLWRTGDYGCRP